MVALLPFSLHVKAEHAHTWSNWEVTCPATCNYEGVKIRYCTECYEEDAEDIPATGKHDWSKWYIEEPSCFTPGSKTRYCEYCNKEEEENIPARGYHTWGKWQILEKADCWNDGEKHRICTVCGKEETKKFLQIKILIIMGSGQPSVNQQLSKKDTPPELASPVLTNNANIFHYCPVLKSKPLQKNKFPKI
ncbi:MAG: hypothetical protein V8S22_04625 [Lachnospiraceae bacterium]